MGLERTAGVAASYAMRCIADRRSTPIYRQLNKLHLTVHSAMALSCSACWQLVQATDAAHCKVVAEYTIGTLC